MTDIKTMQASIKDLETATQEKLRKLDKGVSDTMERRRKQRESQRRPT